MREYAPDQTVFMFTISAVERRGYRGGVLGFSLMGWRYCGDVPCQGGGALPGVPVREMPPKGNSPRCRDGQGLFG